MPKNKRMKQRAFLRLMVLAAVLLYACAEPVSDDDLKQQVETALADSFPGVKAAVENGVTILTGSVANEQALKQLEEKAKSVKGVTQVANDVSALAIAGPNAELSAAVREGIKNYPTLNAIISDSVVILSGNLKRAELAGAVKKMEALQPRQVVTKNIVVED